MTMIQNLKNNFQARQIKVGDYIMAKGKQPKNYWKYTYCKIESINLEDNESRGLYSSYWLDFNFSKDKEFSLGVSNTSIYFEKGKVWKITEKEFKEKEKEIKLLIGLMKIKT